MEKRVKMFKKELKEFEKLDYTAVEHLIKIYDYNLRARF